MVTFGIVPTEAHTGYGYIKRGDALDSGFAVDQFVEKPTFELAQGYMDSKEYYWNSGMFLFKASRYLDELKQFRPEIFEVCQASLAGKKADLDFIRIDSEIFESCPSDSVDYAVMEKTEDAIVVPLEAGWSDIWFVVFTLGC